MCMQRCNFSLDKIILNLTIFFIGLIIISSKDLQLKITHKLTLKTLAGIISDFKSFKLKFMRKKMCNLDEKTIKL